jgi:hypothetical protein
MRVRSCSSAPVGCRPPALDLARIWHEPAATAAPLVPGQETGPISMSVKSPQESYGRWPAPGPGGQQAEATSRRRCRRPEPRGARPRTRLSAGLATACPPAVKKLVDSIVSMMLAGWPIGLAADRRPVERPSCAQWAAPDACSRRCTETPAPPTKMPAPAACHGRSQQHRRTGSRPVHQLYGRTAERPACRCAGTGPARARRRRPTAAARRCRSSAAARVPRRCGSRRSRSGRRCCGSGEVVR